ncbi:MAG: GYD domain-containing protein [Streptosporangiaceae bacterium]
MINTPGDRTAAVRQLADSMGGSVESVYWMLGTYDGILSADAPTRSAPPR